MIVTDNKGVVWLTDLSSRVSVLEISSQNWPKAAHDSIATSGSKHISMCQEKSMCADSKVSIGPLGDVELNPIITHEMFFQQASQQPIVVGLVLIFELRLVRSTSVVAAHARYEDAAKLIS